MDGRGRLGFKPLLIAGGSKRKYFEWNNHSGRVAHSASKPSHDVWIEHPNREFWWNLFWEANKYEDIPSSITYFLKNLLWYNPFSSHKIKYPKSVFATSDLFTM